MLDVNLKISHKSFKYFKITIDIDIIICYILNVLGKGGNF